MSDEGRLIKSIEIAGGNLDSRIPRRDGSRFDNEFRQDVRDFQADAKENVSALLQKFFRRFDHYKLRWVDLYHTPFECRDPETAPSPDYNLHDYVGRPRSNTIRTATWNWFVGYKDRLFLTPRVFTKCRYGALVTNWQGHNGIDNLSLLDVSGVMSLVAGVFQSDSWAQRLSQAGSQNEDVVKELLERFLETLLSHQELTPNSALITNAPLLSELKLDPGKNREAFLRYSVTTLIYDLDLLTETEGSGYFFYLYLPFLATVSKIITGTALGYAGPEPITDTNRLAELRYYNAVWAQYAVRAETKRQRSVAQYKSAVAAVMSRNFSHNVGSHSLANPRVFRSVGQLDPTKPGDESGAKERLSTYHRYCQSRLDFIARTLSYSALHCEPLFLFSDVLRRFFRQTVLLDTLLDDLGFSLSGICFTIKGPNDQGWRVHWQGEPPFGAPEVEEFGEPEDPLVGVYGGMIGCHALYSFLENVARNAAKYGRSARDVAQLEIVIEWNEAKLLHEETDETRECVLLTIRDSLSERAEDNDFADIRHHLKTEIVDPESGEVAYKGRGIQEMKVCTFLLAGTAVFPADKDNDVHELPYSEAYSSLVHRLAENEQFRVELPRLPLRCLPVPRTDPTIAYQMPLPKPRLLGLVSPFPPMEGEGNDGAENRAKPRDLHPLAREYPSLADLANHDAHFGVILDQPHRQDYGAEVAKQVACYHTALPYRLMILTQDKHRSEVLDDQVKAAERDPALALPCRRLRVVSAEEVKDLFNLSAVSQERWEEICLRDLYDTWLRAFKPLPPNKDRWRLCIGFGREIDPNDETGLGATWKQLNSLSSRLFHAYVYAQISSSGEPALKPHLVARSYEAPDLAKDILTDLPSSPDREIYVMFDNHGEFFQGLGDALLDESPAHYHRFGKEQVSLYQTLESPPESPLGLQFFLLSLLEASLARIAIVDERVAQATLQNGKKVKLNGGLYLSLQRAGVQPLFSIKNTAGSFYLSKRIADAVAVDTIHQDEWKREGLWIDDVARFSTLTWRNCVDDDERPGADCEEDFDAVLIHEGVIDLAIRSDNWRRDDEKKLYPTVPAVLRTSGRGAESRHLSQALPFVEFSEISGSTYQELNKLSLVRAVMGARGPAPPEQT